MTRECGKSVPQITQIAQLKLNPCNLWISLLLTEDYPITVRGAHEQQHRQR